MSFVVGCDADDSVDDAAELRAASEHCHGHEKRVYPDPDWQIGQPEDYGLSTEGLSELAQLAEGYGSSCVAVVKDGVLVGEWYWGGYGPEIDVPFIWSAQKSVYNTLLGIAQKQELLHIDDPASAYVPALAGTPSEEVTIRQLMSHTSGREWEFAADLFGLIAAPDQTAYALSFGQDHPPGTHWVYSNSAAQLLEPVLESVVGDVPSFAEQELFGPLGMSVEMLTDAAGNTLAYRGLSASCRDMARFGLLWAREGKWENRRLVSKSWFRQSTTPSSEFNDAYGLLWWLNTEGHVVLSAIPQVLEYEGQMFPSAPENVFMALGAFGQLLMVDAERDLVLVRLHDYFNVNSDPLTLDQSDGLWGALEDAHL